MPLLVVGSDSPTDVEALGRSIEDALGFMDVARASPASLETQFDLMEASRLLADAFRAIYELGEEGHSRSPLSQAQQLAVAVRAAISRAVDLLHVARDLERATGPTSARERLAANAIDRAEIFAREANQRTADLRAIYNGDLPRSPGMLVNRWPYWSEGLAESVLTDYPHVSDIYWWCREFHTAVGFDALQARQLMGALGANAQVRTLAIEAGSLGRRVRAWWRDRGRAATTEAVEDVVRAARTQQLGRPLSEQAHGEASAVAAVLGGMQQLAGSGSPGEAVVQTNTMTAVFVVADDGRWSTRVVTHTPGEVGQVGDDPEGLIESIRRRVDAALPPPSAPDRLLTELPPPQPPRSSTDS